MSLALPQAVLDSLTSNPIMIVAYILLLLIFALITNADKLRSALRRPQIWEVEQARLEANLKYWELQSYKKAQGFENYPDPYEDVAPVPSTPHWSRATSTSRELTYLERFGYAALGAYIGASPPLPPPTGVAAMPSASYFETLLVLVAIVVTVGLLIASLGRRIRMRAVLILAGALGVPTIAALVALAIAGVYLAAGRPLVAP